jgi:polysaccharide export outer membrane protein
MQRVLQSVWWLAVGLLLAAPLTAVAQVSRAGATGAADGAAEEFPLRAGDLLRLRIWREPDLSGDFAVDETGTVVLPKIGPMRVTGESPDSLKAKVVSAYRQYLSHSAIEVMLLRRVQVLGAVRTPGLYSVDATMTLGDALALAGGATPTGNLDKLVLIRNGKRLPGRFSRNTKVVDSPLQSGDEIFVPEKGWLARDPRIFAAIVAASVTLFIGLRR